MSSFTLKELIYSKCFPSNLQQDLLTISDSPNWVEDLVDFAASNNSQYCEICNKDQELVDQTIELGEILEKMEEKFFALNNYWKIEKSSLEEIEKDILKFRANAFKKKIGERQEKEIITRIFSIVDTILEIGKNTIQNQKEVSIGGITCPIR